MVEIVPLEQEHLEALNADQIPMRMRGECYAMLDDGRPVAAAGLTPDLLRPGVGLLWSVQSDAVAKSARLTRRFHQKVTQIFPIVLEGMGLERIETFALADSPKLCRWLEYLGFECETRYALYVRK